MKNKRLTLELTSKQIDLLSESILEKIRTNRNASEVITNESARYFLSNENDELEVLRLIIAQA